MKSAQAFVNALEHGLTSEEAFASLPDYRLPYRDGIPVEIYYTAQQLGWQYFPVSRTCRRGDESQLIDQATSRLSELKLWGRRRDNWALATGSASGVLALAVVGSEGVTSLLSACRDDWSWLDTLRTSAGETRYNFFAWPTGQPVLSGSIGEGLRILGDGGWVFMPPSREKGVPYVYLNPHLIVGPTPEWILSLLTRRVNEGCNVAA